MEELYVIEEPKGKSKLDEENKIKLERILREINKIRKNILEIETKKKLLETVLDNIKTSRDQLTPDEKSDKKNPKRHLISKVRTTHLERLQNKKTQDNFPPLS